MPLGALLLANIYLDLGRFSEQKLLGLLQNSVLRFGMFFGFISMK